MLTLGAAWAVAAAFAAVVAWQGVGLVGDQVTDERPPTRSAAEVEAELAGAATTSTSAPAAVVTEPTAPPTTGVPAPEPVVRSYRVTGGTAAFAFTPAGVTVAYAAPDLGYQMRSEDSDGGWRIEFEGPAGRSRIEGWWDGGPQDRVEDAAGTRRGDVDGDD
jgi:hypothetical protein